MNKINSKDLIGMVQFYQLNGVEMNYANSPSVNNFVTTHISEIKASYPIESKIENIEKIVPVVTHSPSINLLPENLNQAKSLALEIAEKSNSIEELKKGLLEFKSLSVCKTATNLVFGDGVVGSKVILIGEAPGEQEDLRGIPFCGSSGILLDVMLSKISLTRDKNLYITNNIWWRPPANRKPTNEELTICKPILEKYISLLDPKLIILCGSVAANNVLQNNFPISKIRDGKILDYTNSYSKQSIPAMAIFHPSYLLRNPIAKKKMWFDLLQIKEFIKERVGN